MRKHLFFWPAFSEDAKPDDLERFLGSGWFKRLLIGVRSRWRYPLLGPDSKWSRTADNRARVHQVLRVCERLDVEPILLHHYWPDLPSFEPVGYMADPMWHIANRAFAEADAKSFSIGSAIDLEPNAPEPSQITHAVTFIKGRFGPDKVKDVIPGTALANMHRHDSGPIIDAMHKAWLGAAQPACVVAGWMKNDNHFYSRAGKLFVNRIAIPLNYDPKYADRAPDSYAQQWTFSDEKADMTDLEETDRRVLVYVGDKQLGGWSNIFAANPYPQPAPQPAPLTNREWLKKLDEDVDSLDKAIKRGEVWWREVDERLKELEAKHVEA